MLQGLDPIIIFQIYKRVPSEAAEFANVPLTSRPQIRATFAVIPLYLSELLTGVYIDTESKNIDIDTDQNGLSSGLPAPVNQRPLGSVTSINLVGKRSSVGLTILLALAEMILDKVVSQEYEVTYINGAVSVYGGLIHGFSYEQGADNDLYKIKIDLARGRQISKSVEVQQDPNAERLGTEGITPPPDTPTTSSPATGFGGGKSVISPRLA